MSITSPTTTLLAKDALKGSRIAISVSDSPDLARLGLLEVHFRLALAEIARCVLVMGGGLAYGGHILPQGYTTFLMGELAKYANDHGSLHLCLSWQEHRTHALSKLKQADAKLGIQGRLIFLDPQGREINRNANRGEDAEQIDDAELRKTALTAMRQFMTGYTQGRVLLGGKRHGFQGNMPGLLEEALMAVKAGQPLYLAGGFGGVTLDIAQALMPDMRPLCAPHADALAWDEREKTGMEALVREVAGRGWVALNNGLSEEENRHLAATHRPREIAALVSLGLGRCGLRKVDGTSIQVL